VPARRAISATDGQQRPESSARSAKASATNLTLPRDGRCRTLTPVVTIYVFLLQVLSAAADNTAMTNRPRLSGKRFTPAAYCQARKRVPLAAPRRLLHEAGLPVRAGAGGDSRWRGDRTWLIDGSSGSPT
jgi:hypothetical protein